MSITMDAVARFGEMVTDPKFRGWPLEGEYELGEELPFFGQVLRYKLRTGNGIEEYVSLLRFFGWAVVFGVTTEGQVVTLVQWKPGVNEASWELPPGGIGKIPSGLNEEDLLKLTRDTYLKETGYGGGTWTKLSRSMIETGKFRGTHSDDRGVPAHLYLAQGLVSQQEARHPEANEIMETLLVPLEEFDEVIDSGRFVEVGALACALLAMRRLRAS